MNMRSLLAWATRLGESSLSLHCIALSYGRLKRFLAFDFAFDVVESLDLKSYENEVLACLGFKIRRVEFVQGSSVGVLRRDIPSRLFALFFALFLLCFLLAWVRILGELSLFKVVV